MVLPFSHNFVCSAYAMHIANMFLLHVHASASPLWITIGVCMYLFHRFVQFHLPGAEIQAVSELQLFPSILVVQCDFVANSRASL